MKEYIKPSVEKVKTASFISGTKQTFCSGKNSRKMPVGNFTKK